MRKGHLNIILFIAFLTVFSLLNLFQTGRPTVSMLENRSLKAMPVLSLQALWDGSYFKDLEEHFADTFVFREHWVRAANDLKSLKGFTDDTGAVLLAYNNNMADTMMQPEPEPGLDGSAWEEGTGIRPEGDGEANLPQGDDEGVSEGDTAGVQPPKPSQTPDSDSGVDSGQTGGASQSGSSSGSGQTGGASASGGESGMNQTTEAPSSPGTSAEAPSSATPQPTAPSEQAGSPAPQPSKPAEAEAKKVGGVLIANGRAMETHYFNEASCKTYAETLNHFQSKMKEGVKVYSLVAPIAIEFYNVDKFKDITSPQNKTIATINSYFNSAIVPVDAYTPISAHTDEYLYFRTDHHWTATGAYYAYTGFMKTLGEEPVPLSRYETDQYEGFLGSLYQTTLNKTLAANPDTITVYKPFIPHDYHIYYEGPLKMNLIDKNRLKDQNKYRIFMSGDRPWSVIKTNVKNGKKIVVIKDSYGNAFIPFLLPHFEEIVTVDPRQFKLNIVKLMEEKGIDTVLFLNYVNAIGQKAYLELIAQMITR